MSQPLRIERPGEANLLTTRTQNSRLWFVNNQRLQEEILGSLARYQQMHKVILYAFVIQGNHIHMTAEFPLGNRASFMRDFNAQVARLCKRFIPKVGRGKFWGRRFASQAAPRARDVERCVFYCALQPVPSGLAMHPANYPSYNSFDDAVNGRIREYLHTDWTRYNNARRWNPNVAIENYQRTYRLQFSRVPGTEGLSSEDYRSRMSRRHEDRRVKLVKKRLASGKGFAPVEALRRIKPGARPRTTKLSSRRSHRPLVLTSCPRTRSNWLANEFRVINRYREASERYRGGDVHVRFPPGTYRPPLLTAAIPPSDPKHHSLV